MRYVLGLCSGVCFAPHAKHTPEHKPSGSECRGAGQKPAEAGRTYALSLLEALDVGLQAVALQDGEVEVATHQPQGGGLGGQLPLLGGVSHACQLPAQLTVDALQ